MSRMRVTSRGVTHKAGWTHTGLETSCGACLFVYSGGEDYPGVWCSGLEDLVLVYLDGDIDCMACIAKGAPCRINDPTIVWSHPKYHVSEVNCMACIAISATGD